MQQPIDREQLEETKAGMLRAFPNNYSSNRAINAQLGSLGFYGHPANYLDEYPKLLEKITAEDVQNAVRKHLHPEQMTLIVVSKELNKTNLKDILLNHQQSEPLSSKDSAPLISSQPIQTIAQPKAEVDAPAQSQNDKPALTSNTAPY